MTTQGTKTLNTSITQESTMANATLALPAFSLPTSHSVALAAYLKTLDQDGSVDVDGAYYYSHHATLVALKPSTRIHGLDSEVRTSQGWHAKVLVWSKQVQGSYECSFHYVGIDAFGRLGAYR